MTKLFSIENTILQKDRRGISILRPYLAPNFVANAAKFILSTSGTVFIATGFFVNGTAETDGLLGALVLGEALAELGYRVIFISDKYALPLLHIEINFPAKFIEFPITSHEESQHFAADLVNKFSPAVFIAIERCGMTALKKYKNCRGKEISEFTAKVDYLFEYGNSIGIGDGGNEIGMGNLQKPIQKKLKVEPAITEVDHLIISSVSNWGAYGLVAYLSQMTGKTLLPRSQAIKSLLGKIVAKGAVDGITGKSDLTVDGFEVEVIEEILNKLHKSI